jgi:lipid-binding SYLF domain-containing protein
MKMKPLPLLFMACFLWASLAVAGSPAWAQKGGTKAQKQAEVRKTVKDTLNRLYKLQPSSKEAIRKAAGYAVFSNFGMKIFLAGSGTGEGMAVNNATKKETFMKMIEVQAGLGFGVKKFRLVWVFQTEGALDSFISSGWELGSQSTAAAKYEGQGGAMAGAVAISKDVWLYQLTDEGLAAELTAKETKYYKDDDLN